MVLSPPSAKHPQTGVIASIWKQLQGHAFRLVEDRRGALTTEYVLLVGTVGLIVVGALVAVGPLLLSSYERSRAILIGPFPLVASRLVFGRIDHPNQRVKAP